MWYNYVRRQLKILWLCSAGVSLLLACNKNHDAHAPLPQVHVIPTKTKEGPPKPPIESSPFETIPAYHGAQSAQRQAATTIQAHYRGYRVRKAEREAAARQAATTIQAYFRGDQVRQVTPEAPAATPKQLTSHHIQLDSSSGDGSRNGSTPTTATPEQLKSYTIQPNSLSQAVEEVARASAGRAEVVTEGVGEAVEKDQTSSSVQTSRLEPPRPNVMSSRSERFSSGASSQWTLDDGCTPSTTDSTSRSFPQESPIQMADVKLRDQYGKFPPYDQLGVIPTAETSQTPRSTGHTQLAESAKKNEASTYSSLSRTAISSAESREIISSDDSTVSKRPSATSLSEGDAAAAVGASQPPISAVAERGATVVSTYNTAGRLSAGHAQLDNSQHTEVQATSEKNTTSPGASTTSKETSKSSTSVDVSLKDFNFACSEEDTQTPMQPYRVDETRQLDAGHVLQYIKQLGFKASNEIFQYGMEGQTRNMFFHKKDTGTGENTYITLANDTDNKDGENRQNLNGTENLDQILDSIAKEHMKVTGPKKILIGLQQTQKKHWTLLEIYLKPNEKSQDKACTVTATHYDSKGTVGGTCADIVFKCIGRSRTNYVEQCVKKYFPDTEHVNYQYSGDQSTWDHHNCGRYMLAKMTNLIYPEEEKARTISDINKIINRDIPAPESTDAAPERKKTARQQAEETVEKLLRGGRDYHL